VDLSLQNIEIRPIRSDDGERLQASHALLSTETVYRRYLAHKPQLTAADARYLVDIDGCDHFALVATLDEEIIAVARFIRIETDPGAAEFAIVVRDVHQRQGLATELLLRLASAAVRRGVQRFRATILSENTGIRRLVHRIAAGPVRERREGTVSEIEFDLRPAAGRTVAPGPAMIAGCAGS
jgi:RimJ/RimL family protein N-acetyltransferase